MSSSFFEVDGQPVFLTFKKYSEILRMCEAAGKISENDSFCYEMAGNKKLHKKVYKAICQCLSEYKINDFENYNSLFYNFSCYDEEAKDNLFRLLDALCIYFNDYYLEDISGKNIFEAIDVKDIGDIRFAMGERYFLCHAAKHNRTNMRIFINTAEIESFHGNLECFVISFLTGLVLKMDHGVVNIYYVTKPRNDIPEDKSDENIDDEEMDSIPSESEYFYSLSEALKTGLSAYIKDHPAKTLSDFYDALTRDLEAFSNGTEINNYVFSISTKTDSYITYLSFNIEPSLIEVSCGSCIYDPDVGSDSYTNWMYSIWKSGDEDADQIDITDFDMIYSLFCDPDAEFNIETPDEFFYSSITDDRDEEYQEVY